MAEQGEAERHHVGDCLKVTFLGLAEEQAVLELLVQPAAIVLENARLKGPGGAPRGDDLD